MSSYSNTELENLKLDKQELEEIMNTSDRANVKSLLKDFIINLSESIFYLEKTSEKEDRMRKIENEITSFITVTKYSWADGEKSVKIYVNIPEFKDIDKHSIEKTKADFEVSSLEIKIFDWKDKNYKFLLKNLQRDYDTKNSTLKLTKSGLTIALKKFEDEDWFSLVQ